MENVKLPSDFIPAVLERVKRDYVQATYKIDSWDDATDFMDKLAKRSGRLLKVWNESDNDKCSFINLMY